VKQMNFTVIDRSRLAYQVSQQIIELIRKGVYVPGDRLPSERELAEKMGVSRGSVREALSTLQAAGIVTTKNGAGTFVNDRPLSKKAELKALANALSDESPIDILEVREAIETKAAWLAAENRTDEDIENMRSALIEQRKIIEQQGDPRPADMAFHLAVAEATHNPVLIEIVKVIQSLMKRTFWELLMNNLANQVQHDEESKFQYIKEHEEILQAIIEQDAERAKSLMFAHITNVANNISKLTLSS